MIERREGYDLAIAALRSWAAGFHGGSEGAKWLWAAAGDLERNRDAVLSSPAKEPME